MKKLAYLFIFLLLFSFAYSEVSTSTLNFLTKNRADTLYCALNAASCIFLGNITFAGDVHFIGDIFNVTVTNVFINITNLAGEHWVNETYEIGNQTFAQIANNEDVEIRLETDVNENAYLYYMESDSNILGFRAWYDGSGGGTYKIDAIDGSGDIIPKFELDRDDNDADFFVNEDLNDNNITNVQCIELNDEVICDWSNVNQSITDINISEGTGEHWVNETGDTMTGDLNILTNLSVGGNIAVGLPDTTYMLHLQSDTRDVGIFLEADVSNDDESDNPFIKMSQDGGAVSVIMGAIDTANQDPEGNVYTGTQDNDFLLGTTYEFSGFNFGVANAVKMVIKYAGDIRIFTNLSVGSILAPTADLSVLVRQGGTSGSAVSGFRRQVDLGGPYNVGPNGANGVKLWIGDYSNDGETVYPIYVEDENNLVDFWLKSRPGGALKPTAYFGGKIGIQDAEPTHELSMNGSIMLNRDNDKIYFSKAGSSIYFDGSNTIFNNEVGNGNWTIPSGKLGIGIVPTSSLHIYGAGLQRAYIESTSGQASVDLVSLSHNIRLIAGNTANPAFYIYDTFDAKTRFAIDTDGNVGIRTGLTVPKATLHVNGDTLLNGSLNVSGNVTAENVWLPVYISSHTDDTMPVISSGVWVNITFDQEADEFKKRITHNHNDGTNTTFTIQDNGIYEITYTVSLEDSATVPNSHIVTRITNNDVELNGFTIEDDLGIQNQDASLHHSDLVGLSTGDEIKLSFTSDDTTVSLSSHQTYGTHKNTGHLTIKRVG